MKITVKTTQQKVFQLDLDPSDSIAALKAKIENDHGHPAATQKIIYSGKILTDDKTVESCGIKEKDFLVLMVSKPKPTPTPVPVPSSSISTSTSTPQAPPAPVTEAPVPASQPAVAQDPAPASVAEPTPAGLGDGSAFLSGSHLQSAIDNMVEMGFPRDQVLRALRASFNNPDRAVEYLMTGIPSHLDSEANPPPAAAPAAQSQPPAAPPPAAPAQPQNLFQLAQQHQGNPAPHTPSAGPGSVPTDAAALRNNPQLQQIRELIQSNPEAIQPLIQQFAGQNPALAQFISQNPEAFLQALASGGEDDGEGPIPPGAQVINVTPEEREAITRLEALGFSRQQVLEAYLACDKNEELAANYLFESNFED